MNINFILIDYNLLFNYVENMLYIYYKYVIISLKSVKTRFVIKCVNKLTMLS